MAFYNENGSYAYDYRDPDYSGVRVAGGHLRALPEQHCPKKFWSQETFFLDKLCDYVHKLWDEDWKHHCPCPDDWTSQEFGSLTTLRLYVYDRLIESADKDAEDAGFDEWSLRDYYLNIEPD